MQWTSHTHTIRHTTSHWAYIKQNRFSKDHCACVGLMVFIDETFHYNLDWFIQFNYKIILCYEIFMSHFTYLYVSLKIFQSFFQIELWVMSWLLVMATNLQNSLVVWQKAGLKWYIWYVFWFVPFYFFKWTITNLWK